jgi:outer membrane protein OmpA-like peptidoglycan-associated protein
LRTRGVSASRVATRGYGAAYPIADNGTEIGQASNRRVEIKLVPLR